MKKRTEYKIIISLLFVLLCVCISGCKGGATERESDKTLSGSEIQYSDKVWRSKGFVLKDTLFMDETQEKVFYEVAYGEVEKPKTDFIYEEDSIKEIFVRNLRYSLLSGKESDKDKYVLVKYNTVTDETQEIQLMAVQELSPERILCMDIVTEKEFAFLCINRDESCLVCIRVNDKGERIAETDLTDSYAKNNVSLTEVCPDAWWCDESGNIYLAYNDMQSLLVLDGSGKVVIHQDFTQEQGSVLTGFHSVEGSLILAVNSPLYGETKLVWFDTDNVRLKELVNLKQANLKQFTMYENGEIYFLYQSRVCKWNVNTGECIPLYSILGSNIPDGFQEYVKNIGVMNEEELQLIIQKAEGLEYVLLSSDERGKESIRLVDFIGQPYLRNSVTSFNLEHGENTIGYETVAWSDEQTWNRTMADLSAGKGPDILCLPAGDDRVMALYEKGVLNELSDMVPRDVKRHIFPGIMEVGTIGGDYIGVCPEASAYVLITANATWKDEYWSQEDILSLTKENVALEGLFADDEKLSALKNLEMLISNMNTAGLIDWENGESHFEAETFADIMQTVKELGESDNHNVMKGVEEGTYLAAARYIPSPYVFVELCNHMLSKDLHMVGYPSQQKYIGYWHSAYLVLVNKESQYKEEISEFLELLLDKENQKKVSHFCVREDVIRDMLYYDEYVEEWMYGSQPYKNGTLFKKPDGGHYLEEFVTFLKKLGPAEYDTNIQNIILEEAEAYFYGQKDIKTTVEVIDNRVQLYLDERR